MRISSQVLGAVIDNADGATRIFRGHLGVALQETPGRHASGLFKAKAGQKQRVRQEIVQLCEVFRAAFRQVDVRLRGDVCGNCRVLGEFGIGRLLTRDEDGGNTGVHKVVDAGFPGAAATEKSDDDDIGAVGKRGQIIVEQTRRVCPTVGHLRVGLSGRAGGQKVGIRGRQQQNHGVVIHFLGSNASPVGGSLPSNR